MHDEPRKTSDVIREIINACEKNEKISVGEFVSMLGGRGFCLVILIFSLPNSLPVPGIPGFSTITGIPIMLIAIQMIIGQDSLWLPSSVSKKEFSRRGLARMLTKAYPWVRKLEKVLKPRMTWMRSGVAQSFLGVVFLALAGIISLPIPGGNFLPGLSMSLIALAVLQRDGLFLLFSLAFAVGSSYFMVRIIVEFFSWAAGVLQGMF